MLISYNANPTLFMQQFIPNGIQLDRSLEFMENLLDALKKGKSVEFLYEINNKYTYSVGVIIDIFISPQIANIDTFVFIVDYLDKQGNQKYFISPPMYDDTVEFNDINLDKYYLKTLLNNDQDPRYRITIL